MTLYRADNTGCQYAISDLYGHQRKTYVWNLQTPNWYVSFTRASSILQISKSRLLLLPSLYYRPTQYYSNYLLMYCYSITLPVNEISFPFNQARPPPPKRLPKLPVLTISYLQWTSIDLYNLSRQELIYSEQTRKTVSSDGTKVLFRINSWFLRSLQKFYSIGG